MAIQDLCRRLDRSAQSLVVAVLASIVFMHIEWLIGLETRVKMHIEAGCAMLESLSTEINKTLIMSPRPGSHVQIGSSPPLYDLLSNAMSQLTAQVNHSAVL